MAFLPASETREPEGLILSTSEAARRRALEAARTRAAKEMVAQFFGLASPAAAR
jgi:hypothetical protein